MAPARNKKIRRIRSFREAQRANLRKSALKISEHHRKLPEALLASVMIRPSENAVHLVEIFKDLPNDDEEVHRPFEFGPDSDSPFHSFIYMGSLVALRAAIRKYFRFSQWIANGDVIYDPKKVGAQIVAYARKNGRYRH